jgi:heme exporter protein A
MELRLTALNLKKVFNRRVIFGGVSFSLTFGQTLLISGRNGSGKSTLVKILGEVLTPTDGEITLEGARMTSRLGRFPFVGVVAPYLQLYEEFTARENLDVSLRLRGLPCQPERASSLLERFGLKSRKNDVVRTFSSGMKQRVKYAMALVHEPPVLLLDEPMSNLDEDGINIVRSAMEEHHSRGILVVATSDLTDLGRFDLHVDLNAAR